ncbi:MAG TPA: glycosyltransferase family 39 protein [Gemmatimonadaceae bacterium]|nr:glycosyltransferase family 39 protein [Gemmatimonadaceae bacterium]
MRSLRVRHLLLLLTWLAAGVLVVCHHRDAFYDVDEGQLGETAERVMHGELPHRDFVDVYTGGLAVIDAAGFRVWGVSAETMRTVLLVATLLWIPVLFLVAERLARPGPWAMWAASLATMTAVVWSVPNHPRGMPTWFTLFFATAGAGAMLRYVDTRRGRWLLVAGIIAGLSCTIKIVGLYFIAAVLLFAVFDEQETDRVAAGEGRPTVTWYTLLSDAALVLYAVAVAWLVRGQGVDAFVQYALPSAAVSALLIWREHTARRALPVVRAARLVGIIGPFMVGVAIPVLVFLVPYARSGAVGALLRGVFITPMARIGHIAMLPPPAVSVLAAVPLIAGLGLIGRQASGGALARVLVSVVALAVVTVSGVLQPWADPALRTPAHVVSRLVRDAVHGLIPLLAVVGVIALARRRTAIDARAVALIVAVMATGALVQFPYALDQYYWFVAPLVVLAALALAPTRGAVVVAVGCLVFALVRLDVMSERMAPLAIPRGGPLVSADINEKYQTLVRVVRDHARGGEYIYAGPDSPQVYFLTGYRNPTGTIYEMFDDTTGRTSRVLRAIDAHGVTTVVITVRPDNVSGPMDPVLRAALTERFPETTTVGQYVVRWR